MKKRRRRYCTKERRWRGLRNLAKEQRKDWWVFDWLLSKKRSRIGGKERGKGRRGTRMTTRR
jgi:hypothetical protein